VPNPCEQYVEFHEAGVLDALPRVRWAETRVPWLVRYRKSRVFTLIESMFRSRGHAQRIGFFSESLLPSLILTYPEKLLSSTYSRSVTEPNLSTSDVPRRFRTLESETPTRKAAGPR
jgi:hypothetical protein